MIVFPNVANRFEAEKAALAKMPCEIHEKLNGRTAGWVMHGNDCSTYEEWGGLI